LSTKLKKPKLPRWRNGSVFVLHAKGDSSILSRGTKMGMISDI
jgi:hypothetical protein